jgi:hypothetical protein
MAETILAGEQVEKFAGQQRPAVLAPGNTVFARLAKDFFVRHRPGDTGDRDCQDKKPNDLLMQRRHPLFDA